MHRSKRIAIAAVAALGMGCGLDAFWLEPSRLIVREETLVLPGWPPACDGVRIAVLADLHVGSPFHGPETLPALVGKTRATHADLVLLAGDYISGVLGGTEIPPETFAPGLAPLQASPGAIAVLGNHDAGFGSARVAAAFAASGIPVLDDASMPVAIRGCRFRVAGISDYFSQRHDVHAALAGVVSGEPVIALTHSPDVFPDVPSSVALTVAGHTHGGQVRLPFVGAMYVPSRFGQRYVVGHIVEGGRHLFVSPGIGTSIIPVRFRVPPEISVLVLRAGEARATTVMPARAGNQGSGATDAGSPSSRG